jgi:hypothetical protein
VATSQPIWITNGSVADVVFCSAWPAAVSVIEPPVSELAAAKPNAFKYSQVGVSLRSTCAACAQFAVPDSGCLLAALLASAIH